jgi:mannose-1-phosphate guanylyltransferase
MTERDVIGAVLCAGFGTRLRPLTEAIPKPLLPFLNTPIVSYALDHLSRAGIERVALNLHHLADTIPPVVDLIGAQFGLKPVYSREWDILGTAGGIRGMWRALGEPDATMVVLNGDSIMNLDLAAHLAAHRRSGRRATLVVRPKADDQPGRVWLDADGNLRGLRDMRHPDAADDLREYDFTGVHLIEPELLAEIPMEKGCMVGDIYGPLLEKGEEFHASTTDDFWAALDNPGLFLETTRRVLDEPELFAQAPLPEPLKEGLFIYKPEQADDKAACAAPVLLGLYASVEAGAKLGPNAVVDGCEVSGGASIRNAVVYGMGRIEGEWRDCIAVAGKVAQVDD